MAERWSGGRVGHDLSAELQRKTGGNALFLTQYLRALPQDASLMLGRARQDLSVAIRAIVRERTESLSSAGSLVLGGAAILGYEFDLGELKATLTRWGGVDVSVETEALATVVLLEPVDEAATRFRFVHALLYEAILADMPIAMKTELHNRVAETLEALPGMEASRRARELYRHVKASGCRDRRRLSEYACSAGRSERERLAYESAMELYLEGLEVLGEEEEPRLRAELHRAAAVTSKRGMIHESWIPVCELHFLNALSIYLDLDDEEELRGLIHEPVCAQLVFEGMFPTVQPFARLRNRLPEDPMADLFHYRATALSAENSRESIESLTLIGQRAAVQKDQLAELQACVNLAWAHYLIGSPENAFAPAQRAIELARRIGDLHREAFARLCVIDSLLKIGRNDDAARERRDGERWARVSQDSANLGWCLSTFAIRDAIRSMDWERAWGILHEFETVANATRFGVRRMMRVIYPAMIAVFIGDRNGIDAFVEDMTRGDGAQIPSDFQEITTLFYLVSMTRKEDHVRLLERASIRLASVSGITPMRLWHAYSGLALVHAYQGRPKEARNYRDRFPADKADHGWLRTGIVSLLIGDLDEAITRLGKEVVGSKWGQIDTIYAGAMLAEALFLRGGSTDRNGAVVRLKSILSQAQEHGLGLIIEYAKGCAERFCVDLPDGGDVSAGAGEHPASLTNREIEVLRLIEQGLLNKEIASELNISVRTVHRHVDNILHKIGAGNRTEAAKFAVTHGLT
jgi:DNA-binding CsgD family transcriptional regulator/tetratricopeptide (TPR) repeat protein